MDVRSLLESVVSDMDATRVQEARAWYRIGLYAASAYRGAIDGGAPEQVALQIASQVVRAPLDRT